jgi:hypothetical protein
LIKIKDSWHLLKKSSISVELVKVYIIVKIPHIRPWGLSKQHIGSDAGLLLLYQGMNCYVFEKCISNSLEFEEQDTFNEIYYFG